MNIKNKTKLIHPISHGLSRVKLPLIPISIGGYAICLIIDTGATHSLLDDEVVTELGDLAVKGAVENVLLGVNGDKSKVDRTAMISFVIENHSFTHTFICQSLFEALSHIEKESNIQVHGILGNDFLLENKWIIDYERLEIHSSFHK